MKLQDLPRDLVGGALVEYKNNCGFDLEYGRATITDMGMDGEMFFIKTDRKDAFLTQNVSPMVERMGFTAEVQKQGEIYLIRSSMGWRYALAPKGVEIPQRPHWLAVSDDEFDNSVKKTLMGRSD
jgi:hypothetical protein